MSPCAVIKNVNKVDWAPSLIDDWVLSIRNFVLLMITLIEASMESFKKGLSFDF
jgi:hypothetical protein